MYARDVPPSRIARAHAAIAGLLRERREGLTGLVVYAGDAHVVTPLTDDVRNIENLLPALRARDHAGRRQAGPVRPSPPHGRCSPT